MNFPFISWITSVSDDVVELSSLLYNISGVQFVMFGCVVACGGQKRQESGWEAFMGLKLVITETAFDVHIREQRCLLSW